MEPNDLLSALLSDPERLQSALAAMSGLFGGSTEALGADPSAALLRLMQPAAASSDSDRARLLCALKPFVDARTARAIDRAIRLADLVRTAERALGAPPEQEEPHV